MRCADYHQATLHRRATMSRRCIVIKGLEIVVSCEKQNEFAQLYQGKSINGLCKPLTDACNYLALLWKDWATLRVMSTQLHKLLHTAMSTLAVAMTSVA